MAGNQPKAVNQTAPVISSLRVQTSMQGRAVGLVYGKTRVSGNLIQYTDFRAVAITKKEKSGGKGGGGSSKSTTWEYYATILVGLCAGSIAGVGKVWKQKQITDINSDGCTLFLGDDFQQPFQYMQTHHPDQALAYRSLAYVAGSSYRLDDNAQFPNHSYEVISRFAFSDEIPDAPPHLIIFDVLINKIYGAFAGLKNLTLISGDFGPYINYTIASGLFLSPAYVEQQTAAEILNKLMRITNSGLVYSGQTLKIIPYGDTEISGNGATYTPDNTPVYNLTDDDFLENGSNPVLVKRGNQADAYNRVTVRFYNRNNDYNEDVVVADDQASIALFGLRPCDPIEMYEVCDPEIARNIAQLLLQRYQYIRNTYEFTLSWKYCLLEPMDLVTLTESTGDGLFELPVRIISVEEDEEGNLHFEAEDFPGTVSGHIQYPTQSSGGYTVDFNADPGNTFPVVWEAPDALLGANLEVWVGGSGGSLWGGCDVYVSNTGENYSKLGSITSPLRQGVLSSTLSSGFDPDQANTLAVTLFDDSPLSGGSQADVDTFTTLCYVDGELISYRDCTLTAENSYNLKYLRRGVYNTEIAQHNQGSQFVRIDQEAFFKYAFTPDRIGTYIYIKLVSYNVYGAGYQSIEDVEAIPYKITGAAFTSSLPDIQNLRINFLSGQSIIYWDAIQDFRQPNVQYEIRQGATFANASIVGRTKETSFVIRGDGTYWVSGLFFNGGLSVYSATPQNIVITGGTLTNNVIAQYSESGTGWSGTLGAGLAIDGTEIKLVGSGDILTEANALTITDVINYGGLTQSAIYTLPSGHTVSLADEAACPIIISFSARGDALGANILDVNDVFVIDDITGAQYGRYVSITPQIAVAPSSGVYGAWQDYEPGVYYGKHFKARVRIETSDPYVVAYLSDFNFAVDVPDKFESGNLTTAAGGTSVTYSSPFNVAPDPQITQVGATVGDTIILSGVSSTGFTIQVKDAGGTGVARSINWFAQSY